ncbi:MAG: hypothetical protein ACE5HA_19415 [Anaerolineae bacterium]
MTVQPPQKISISVDDLVNLLEPLMRRVVREELARLVTETPDVLYLEPDSPLYEDMEDILRRKEQGKIRLYSHEEVWGE